MKEIVARIFGLFIISVFISLSATAGTNQSIVYQGRVIRPDGTVANSGFLTFTLSIYSPYPAKCLLYSETQSVSMVGSGGMFSLSLGSGSRIDRGAHSLSQVFINGGALTGLICANGDISYTPNPTDDRSLEVSIVDNGITIRLSPMPVKSVPFALQAHEIDGWGLNNLVKVSSVGSPTTFTAVEMSNVKSLGAASCANGEILKWNGSAWMCSADVSGGPLSDASYSAKGVFQADADAATSGLSFSSPGVLKVNTGTGANQILKLDGSSRLPAVDASQITDLSAAQITAGILPITRGGTGASTKTTAFDALSPNSTKGDITVFNGISNVSLPRGSDGQVLTTDSAQAAGLKWSAAFTGTLTNLTAGIGLNVGAGPGGSITNTGTLNIDVGTGANQIVQLTAASKLPVVDGSLLTNLSTTQISTGTMPISRGGTGVSAFAANNLIGTNSTGAALQTVTCSQNQIISFDVSGNYGCYNLSTIASGTYFANGGNSFGANASLGTIDAKSMTLKTADTERMTISSDGNIGIGTTGPAHLLDIRGSSSSATSALLNLRDTSSSGMSAGPFISFEDSDGTVIGYVGDPSPTTIGMVVSSAGDLRLRGSYVQLQNAGGANTVRVDENGYVGIGTINPNAKIEIDKSSGASIDLLSVVDVDSTRKLTITKDAQLLVQSASGSNNGIRSRITGDTNDRIAISGDGKLSWGDGTNPGDTSILRLPSSSGLSVMGGNVGIGTTSPSSKLHVSGAISSAGFTANAVDSSSALTLDFSQGNLVIVTTTGGNGNVIVSKMVVGGAYTVIIQDGTARTYDFTNGGGGSQCATGTTHYLPSNAATSSGQHSVYSIIYAGTGLCYITWSSGF